MIIRSEDPSVQRLVDVKSGDVVQVHLVPASDSATDPARLRRGEVLQCIENESEGTVMARPDGSRILVPRAYGEAVRVHLCWDAVRGWIPDDTRGMAAS